jgi:hypothetical protein
MTYRNFACAVAYSNGAYPGDNQAWHRTIGEHLHLKVIAIPKFACTEQDRCLSTATLKTIRGDATPWKTHLGEHTV